MKLIKKDGGQQPKVLTVDEMIDGIADSLKKTNGVISGDRLHSVDTHLRTCIRTLGYKPRETTKDGKVATTVTELLQQLRACIAATEAITEDAHAHIHIHLTAIHSNCGAEVGTKLAPELKEAPIELKEIPDGILPAGLQQQQQAVNPEGNELMTKKMVELNAIVADLNADPARTEKITAPFGISKLDLVNIILKAKGLPALIVLFLFVLAMSLIPVQAADSFNITNVIGAGTAVLQSAPTNANSPNLVITGYTTNGNVITTNGYYPGQLTGRGIETRNYTYNGFKFQGVATTTNNGTIWLQPIRAITAGNPPVWQVNSSGVPTNSDWETTPQGNYTIAVPVPNGNGIGFCWVTNFDEWFEKPADWVGFNVISNNLGTGVVVNASAWLGKKIPPFSLSAGN